MTARRSNRIPPTNIAVFALQLLAVAHVSWNFDQEFRAKPILTSMVTNALLNGIADTFAQSLSALRSQPSIHRLPSSKKDPGGVSIEIHELGEKPLMPTHHNHSFPAAASSPFNFDRLVRFMMWGFIMAPIQYAWFAYLAHQYPIGANNKTSAVAWRVLLDQVVFSLISLGLFFAYMTFTEGGGIRSLRRKLSAVFLPALKSNYVVWPAVQVLNFRVVPLPLQLPFASTVGIFWTAYLSLKNEAADA